MSHIRLIHKCCYFMSFFVIWKNWITLRIQDKLDETKLNFKINLKNIDTFVQQKILTFVSKNDILLTFSSNLVNIITLAINFMINLSLCIM